MPTPQQLGGEVLRAAGIDGADVEAAGRRARRREHVVHRPQWRLRLGQDQ
jgi:hypothetical protein